MKTIRKYVIDPKALDADDSLVRSVPRGSTPLSAATHGDQVVVWFEVPVNVPEQEWWRIYVHGTGDEFAEHPLAQFLGTCTMLGGVLVWHVYAKRVTKPTDKENENEDAPECHSETDIDAR
jgi:hypothetical protein